MPDFDLAIIGAGAAGLSVAAAAAQLGVSVALIERQDMGGDCLNTGCVPSKALLAAAHASRTVRDAARFGVIAVAPVIDWDRVRSHVQGVIAAIAPMDSEQRFRCPRRHRPERRGSVHRSNDYFDRGARRYRPPVCHRSRKPADGSADRWSGCSSVLDQSDIVRSVGEAGPFADPGRRTASGWRWRMLFPASGVVSPSSRPAGSPQRKIRNSPTAFAER